MCESKWFFWVTPSIYQSMHSSNLAGFLTHRSVRRNFRAIQTTFEVWVSCIYSPHFTKFVFFFSVWFFKWNSALGQHFAIYIEYRIYNHWNWIVLWWKHRKRKYADFWLSLAIWQCLLNRDTCLPDVWKHFKYWLSSSNLH